MDEEIKSLIEQLVEFQTRSRAMKELVRVGPEAVPQVIDALKSPFSAVRWAAIRILGQIADQRGLEAILPFQKDPELGATASEAIVRLKEKLRLRAAPKAGEPDQERPVESHEKTFMEKVVEGTGIQMSCERNRFRLRVPTSEGRGQTVMVYFGGRDSDGTGFIAVYTECAKANPRHYEWALRQNAKLSAGALALREIGGVPWFVMMSKHLARTADVDELREIVIEVAKKADAIEKALSGVDAV